MSSVEVTDVQVERALLPRLRIMTEISGEANREVLLFGLGGQFYVQDNRDYQDVIVGGITCSRPIVILRGSSAQVAFYVDLDQSRIEAID
jgi:hypothetical protein